MFVQFVPIIACAGTTKMLQSENHLKRLTRAWDHFWTKCVHRDNAAVSIPTTCGTAAGFPCTSLLMCQFHRNESARARATRLGCNCPTGFNSMERGEVIHSRPRAVGRAKCARRRVTRRGDLDERRRRTWNEVALDT